MPRFAANLSMLYPEHEFLDRFAAAAADGFEAVEYLFPYAHQAKDLASRLAEHGLQQVLFNGPPGDWERGERGMAALPGREDEFRRSIDMALQYAQALKCPRVHAMAGLAPAGFERAKLLATYQANLAWAAKQAASAGKDVLIEPINTRDIPGYFLNTTTEGIAILDRVARDNARLQLDLYHCQIMEGDLARHVRELAGRFAHVQIAGVPERQEPDIGEVNYPYVLDLLDETGYDGWVGCEYRPKAGTVAGLGWARRWGVAPG
jgi:hydroxypyruvate isomerase